MNAAVSAMEHQKVPAVRVELSDDQLNAIKTSSVWAQACAASAAGKPGFVAAQILGSKICVFFIDHERALKFQKLMGQEVGATTDRR